MQDTSPTTSNTNTKSMSDTDGFNIPVSSSSAPTASSPSVADFSAPSSGSSNPLFGSSSSSGPDSSPMPGMDKDRFKDNSKEMDPMGQKLSAPIHNQNYSGGKGSKGMTTFIGIIILIVIVGCVYGVYSWQHSKFTKQESVNTALSNTNASLETQLNNDDKTITADQALLDSNTVSVPTLGFSLSVPSSLKDLTVAANTDPTKLTVNGASVTPTEANLSSTSLIALDPACSTASGALGILSKTTGQYPTTPTATNSSGTLIEQFTTYYLAYSTPAACSKTASVNTQQSSLVSELQATLIKSNITLTE